MALEGKILTRLEPTIELDKYKFKSEGEVDADNPGDSNSTREMGVEYPLIIINGKRFSREDIKSFEISFESILEFIDFNKNGDFGFVPIHEERARVRLSHRC